MKKLFPRRRAPLAAALTLALSALCACERAPTLPAKNSAEYRQIVSAFYVGLSALQVGDDVRAEAKLKETTALAPEEPAAWANLGLLYLRQRQHDRAAESVERARQLAPDNSRVHFLAGLVESGRGRYAEATAAFKRAVELDPRNLKALYALASEAERAGDEEEQARLLRRLLEVEPRNLSVQLDAARLAAKRGDAQLFGSLKAGFVEQSAAWPSEAREQLSALEATAAGGNLRAAAPRVQFLRNVLVRLPEFRQSRLAVEDPPEVLSQPFTRFIRLESPDPRPAPPDEGLTYNVETPQLANATEAGTTEARTTNVGADEARTDDARAFAWGGAISLTGEGAPVLAFAGGRDVRLAGGVTLSFPGGPASTAPTQHGVVSLDYNYDFKTDLALAGEGGFRLFRQETATSFTDATATTKLSPSLINTPAWGAWAADIEADGDLDIVLAARDAAPVVLRNNGDASFAEQRPFEPVTALRDFAWADFDGDGDPDAALLDAQGRLHVFTNERTGQFRARPAPPEAAPSAASALVAL
ncbi:MAG TPA: FG-GAP-like repeat-containing protein, partial [Pyrinomonadaceae bacterium]|nr:FG-GAP-like repeat-containing protein [Pyrinomonadaceae bacterium]